MARRPGRRDRIRAAFDELHTLSGAALGAADRLREDAAREHAETLTELWLRESGLDAATHDPELSRVLRGDRLAGTVGRVRADRESALAPWLRAGSPDRLSEIVDEAAPGVAGADPSGWLGTVGTVAATGPVPELWQVGQARLDGGPAFRVGLPLLDGAHLQISSAPRGRARAEELVETLLIRVLSHFRPGTVGVHVWDVGQLRGSMPGLYPLTRTGLLTVHDPTAPDRLLDLLSDRIRRVHTRVLVGGHTSLRSQADATGERTEPWMVAVLLGNRQALHDTEHRQLQRIARGGLACGISLVLVDVPVTLSAAVESVTFEAPPPGSDDGAVRSSMTGTYLEMAPDPHPGREAITRAADAIVDAHDDQRGRLGPFGDLMPGEYLTESSQHGITAPLGFDEGRGVEASLDDATPHALIGGPSGSGKTNLLLTWISAMAARYSPAELQLYMLDFKEGVSFAGFAPDPSREDPPFLPQARLVGININTDREFGLALLQHLSEEMRERAELCKQNRVTKLAELRALMPEGKPHGLPRIVAVVDEFQFLFSESDAVTKEATKLLEDVARRGRSQGIHMVLASQDVAGIEAFWGRPAIFEQFVLRIALPRARRVLANLNEAAMEIPRYHAVVNTESGLAHGNAVVRVPDATGWDEQGRTPVDKVRDQVFEKASESATLRTPTVFDGTVPPDYDALAGTLPGRHTVPVTMVGQAIEVHGEPATVELPDVPGRNLGVLAAGADDAVNVLASAASVLAGQGGNATFHLADLVPGVSGVVAAVERRIEDAGARCETVKPQTLLDTVNDLADLVRHRQVGSEKEPVYLVLFGADAADGLLERQGTESLRTVLHYGPETGVHVLGWWRSAQRLKSLLTMGASMDDLGAWIALDVQGSELNAFAPGLGLTWSPRPGRGLFFDRARHARPQVVFVPDFPHGTQEDR